MVDPFLAETERRAASELAVDVIVSNHNYAGYVAEAVESALAQTHPVRVIVVDDGSTDTSRQLLAAYSGRAELVFKSNGGQASALNAGLARATGDLVLFLDADDVLEPGAIALTASRLAANPGLVKVQYRMAVIDERGRRTGALRPSAGLPLPSGDMRRAELVFPFDLAWAATSANVFRRASLGRLLPIPEDEFASCPDWYLVHLTALIGPVLALEEVGARYRIHGANSFERSGNTLDLESVRQRVRYAAATTRALERLADELDLDRPYARTLSVSDLAHRLVSLRLAPELHPRADDTRSGLALDGWRAAWRRFDVSPPAKVLAAAWFALTALAPRAVAERLAPLALLRDERPRLNRVLRWTYRTPRGDATGSAARTARLRRRA